MRRILIEILVFALIFYLMTFLTVQVINNLEKDRDVWFNKDIKWNSCSCSTEVPEYFDMCQEFIRRCEIELSDEE